MKGSSVYNEIREKTGELERNVESLNRDIYRHEKDIESISNEREEYYASLAQIYLPALDADSVKQTLREVQKDVQKIFQQKQEKRKEIDYMLQTSSKSKEEWEGKLQDVTEQLNQKASERDDLQKKVMEEINANSDYVKLYNQTRQAKDQLEQNQKRVQEAKEDSESKLPAYEANRLFTYLLKREYGTENYQAGNLAGKLDKWVAKIVNYEDSKKNYDFLRAMPELMEAEVQRRQEVFSDLMKKLQAIESVSSDKHGLTKVLSEGLKLGKTREQILSGLNATDAKMKSYTQERKNLDSTKDEYHVRAIQKLKSYLEDASVAELKQRARETPDPEDDKLVEKIEDADREIRKLKDSAKKIRAERESMQEKLDGLNEIASKYKGKDFESGRSRFSSGFDINDLLLGYMAGKYSSGHVWDNIKTNQQFEKEESYSHSSLGYGSGFSSGSSSHHSSSFGSGGNSFGGGIFSSGGGFGGGGFSSGHGF